MRGNEINNLPSLPKLDIPWFVSCKVYHYIPNISIKYWVHIVLDPNFTQETSWLVGFEKQKSRIQSIFQTEESISTRKAAFWDLTKNWVSETLCSFSLLSTAVCSWNKISPQHVRAWCGNPCSHLRSFCLRRWLAVFCIAAVLCNGLYFISEDLLLINCLIATLAPTTIVMLFTYICVVF